MSKKDFFYIDYDVLDTHLSDGKNYLKKQKKQKNRFSRLGYIPDIYTLKSNEGLKKYLSNNFVSIKVSFNCPDTLSRHISYVSRDGCDKDNPGDKTPIYNADGIIEDVKKEFAFKSKKEKRHFRIIISPERNNLDLTDFTKYIVSEIERSTGYSLRWAAANHYNTDHHHSHLIIRGIDNKGRDVRIPKALIRAELRKYAIQYSNSILGMKTEPELYETVYKMSVSKNVTQIDRNIYYKCKDKPLDNGYHIYIPKTSEEISRLKYLSSINYAQPIVINNKSAFRVKKDFIHSLRSEQERKDLTKLHNTVITGDLLRPSKKAVKVRILSRVPDPLEHEKYKYLARDEETNNMYSFSSLYKYDLHNSILLDSDISKQRPDVLRTPDKIKKKYAIKIKN